jgi:hypothetical protein
MGKDFPLDVYRDEDDPALNEKEEQELKDNFYKRLQKRNEKD